jgi:hypothetical protein
MSSSSLHEFVRWLPDEASRAAVLGSSDVAAVVQRGLSCVSQAAVQRALCSSPRTLEAVLFTTTTTSVSSAVRDELSALHLLHNNSSELYAPFADALAQAMRGRLCAWQSAHTVEAELARHWDEEARQRWADALRYIAGTGSAPSAAVADTAKYLRLLTAAAAAKKNTSSSSSAAAVRMTPAAFRFVLQDTGQQLWALLLGRVHMLLDKKAVDYEGAASYVRCFCRIALSQPFAECQLSSDKNERDAVQFAITLGLASSVPGAEADAVVCTTPLARSLCVQQGAAGADGSGWVVVENNFRVYAYTSSPVHIQLLAMFVRMEYRLPNLVVGTITRPSALFALQDCGVSAAQLLQFMRSNAHPAMRRRSPVVPDAVSDQLRRWEAEATRLQCTEGVMFEEFPSSGAFESVRKYCEAHGMLVWSKPWKEGASGGYLFVKQEHADAVTKVIESIDI